MNKNGLGVEVILDIDEDSIPVRPCCPHGPTLLFERYTTNGKNNGRRFFACSANRSRKLCSFFQWADEGKRPDAPEKKLAKEESQTFSMTDYFLRAEKITDEKTKYFCRTCSLLLLSKEWRAHEEHSVDRDVTDAKLSRPSKLLKPQEDNRQHAQYMFSESTVSFIVKTLKDLNFNNVLCIGTPRVHEELLLSGFSSLLMDIDERYAQFYKPSHYARYNMFNHHFFGASLSSYQELLSCDSLCLLIDPPFGGLIDAIAHTIKQIISNWRTSKSRIEGVEPLVMWFFPYFNEPRILQALPSLHMLDFKIEYENHTSFGGGSKHGSPVRLFTNGSPEKFKPPDDHNYRFCDICLKFVANANKHCKKCQSCTSKDGHPYRHCDDCKRCVKASRHHCMMCQQCVPSDHRCGVVTTPGACHICNRIGHKRKQCPSRGSNNKRKKKRN